jgi:hypothetical protein
MHAGAKKRNEAAMYDDPSGAGSPGCVKMPMMGRSLTAPARSRPRPRRDSAAAGAAVLALVLTLPLLWSHCGAGRLRAWRGDCGERESVLSWKRENVRAAAQQRVYHRWRFFRLDGVQNT